LNAQVSAAAAAARNPLNGPTQRGMPGGPSMMPFAPTHMSPRMLNQLMASQRFAAASAMVLILQAVVEGDQQVDIF
jgi:hypothetical protein